MFSKVCLLALICSALPCRAQRIENSATPASCLFGSCITGDTLSAAPSLPSVPVRGKWQVEDFKKSDASVSCAVVKYDSTHSRPILHLLCPGPDIFAPIRVHLTLTWRDVREIPSVMKNMLVDMSRSVRFKSKPGDSKAELTFQDADATRKVKEWISFSEVNVGLVLPPK